MPNIMKTFPSFFSAIYGCLNDAYLKHKNELDSLLTLGFQKFNKSQIMTIQSIDNQKTGGLIFAVTTR
ncbi:hypothetical protein NIES3807_25820 [Microcystis aeruginosa NIES-3807]|uniref:Uncharacterized protein n=1 Tax=Microcystis aeruginosa NIES-3807 TaxID=2517785 RepID=A0AAD3G9D3_MICAE|nr:hypothetical protein NIES3807_25820 [Microcystis aeruginosa NIES-3807]